MAGSHIPSALHKRAVAAAALKGKFLGILDAVPLLLGTLEKSSHWLWSLLGYRRDASSCSGLSSRHFQQLQSCARTPASHVCFTAGQPSDGSPSPSPSPCWLGAGAEPGAVASPQMQVITTLAPGATGAMGCSARAGGCTSSDRLLSSLTPLLFGL